MKLTKRLHRKHQLYCYREAPLLNILKTILNHRIFCNIILYSMQLNCPAKRVPHSINAINTAVYSNKSHVSEFSSVWDWYVQISFASERDISLLQRWNPFHYASKLFSVRDFPLFMVGVRGFLLTDIMADNRYVQIHRLARLFQRFYPHIKNKGDPIEVSVCTSFRRVNGTLAKSSPGDLTINFNANARLCRAPRPGEDKRRNAAIYI